MSATGGWFNRRHNPVGHLFQGRFKAIVVDRERWGLALSRYVHLNPVRTSQYGLTKAARGAKFVELARATLPGATGPGGGLPGAMRRPF